MRQHLTQIVRVVALLLLLTGAGCQSHPESEGAFSIPSFGGVPDQWEPEMVDSMNIDDEDPEIGL